MSVGYFKNIREVEICGGIYMQYGEQAYLDLCHHVLQNGIKKI